MEKSIEQSKFLKAIHKYCLRCSCDSRNEVKLCSITDCPLYPYRMGNNHNGGKSQNENQGSQRNVQKGQVSKTWIGSGYSIGGIDSLTIMIENDSIRYIDYIEYIEYKDYRIKYL